MKRFKFYCFTRALAVLVGAISLASLSTVQANPIYDGPANQANYCMADAYYATGGKGLKNVPGASLNCTANDVEISTVTVKLVDGVGPEVGPGGEEIFTCKSGDPITVTADLRVRTNANERWDTTFYLPLNQESPQVIQDDPGACSILIPKNEFSQDRDLDFCGDIYKGDLDNDEYTLVDATFTMLCDAGDDTQVDFNYCAGWDNQERNNCSDDSEYPGQVPNTTSKCNCDVIPLNIFIQPEPPLVTKTLQSGSPADEPEGTYIYKLKVETQTPDADLTVTALSDYVWSLTDSSFPILYSFDLNSGSVQTHGNVSLLGSDPRYTCDAGATEEDGITVTNLPKVLNAGNLAFECFIVVQIIDDDLPDTQVDELYLDVIKVIAKDDNADNIGECIEPLTGNTVNGTCSLEIQVALQDITPTININKFAISGPGFKCVGTTLGSGECEGSVYIDEPGGDVTYKLVITNTSSVDPLTVTDLDDYVMDGDTRTNGFDLLTVITGNTCHVSLPIELAINGETGDSFTCQFVRDVSGGLFTVRNEAEVIADEKDGHSEGNTATHYDGENVTIVNVPPTVSMMKKVKAITPASGDDGVFSADAVVYEPAGDVLYQFTVTNTSPAGESIRLLSLTDAALAGSRVTETAGGDCAFDGSIIIPIVTDATGTNPYVCTIAATVTGNASGDLSTLVNTAYVTVTDGVGANIDSNDDTATVNFANVVADAELSVNIAATVFVTIRNTSTFEAIKLTQLKLLGSDIVDMDGDATDSPDIIPNFNIINGGYGGDFDEDGESYGACYQPSDTDSLTIAANSSYHCAFTVELLIDANDALNTLSNDSSGGIFGITVEDFDGGPVDNESVNIVVHLVPN